jgi:hypothetical protein
MRYDQDQAPTNQPPPAPDPPKGDGTGDGRGREKTGKQQARPTPQDPTTCQAPPPGVRPRSRTGPPPQGDALICTGEPAHTMTAPTNRCSTREQPPRHTRP